MNEFIAEAVLGRGAHHELLEEMPAGPGSPRSDDGMPTRLVRIDDLDATRTRYRLQEERCREHGDAVGAAEIVEFLAMAEFRAGNWDQAERALEDACATLGQFELRGPLTASFMTGR